MTEVAYVDTSCLVAIAFGERGTTALARRLDGFEELVSSNLLEAELRAAFVREEVPFHPPLLAPVGWVIPDRPLSGEIARALAVGHLCGADLWHVACALYLAPDPSEITFLTLDDRQQSIAKLVGFAT